MKDNAVPTNDEGVQLLGALMRGDGLALNNKPLSWCYSEERGQVLGFIRQCKRILNVRQDKDGSKIESEGVSNPHSIHGGAEIPGKLVEAIGALFGVFIKDNGASVDYDGMAHSEAYNNYLDFARQLPYADLSKLGESNLKGFYINIYNMLVIHSIIELGKPWGMWGRLRMYGTSAYQIGPHVLSLNDIENGILRGNLGGVAPWSDKCTFSSNDKRSELALPRDPRIHCGLNCGAASCPPIRFFEFEKVEEQLEEATQSFISSQKTQEGSIAFSMIFKWYAEDFGSSDSEVGDRAPDIRSALENLMSQKTSSKLMYETYNWDLNSYKS